MNKVRKISLIAFVSIGIFFGIMISSVGVSLFPKLANVSAWVLCGQSRYIIVKQDYSYKPGQTGYYLTFYSSPEKRPEDEVDLLHILLVDFLIYTIGALIILSFFIPLFRKKFESYVFRVLKNNNRI
jgi:hypothetical protein